MHSSLASFDVERQADGSKVTGRQTLNQHEVVWDAIAPKEGYEARSSKWMNSLRPCVVLKAGARCVSVAGHGYRSHIFRRSSNLGTVRTAYAIRIHAGLVKLAQLALAFSRRLEELPGQFDCLFFGIHLQNCES